MSDRPKLRIQWVEHVNRETDVEIPASWDGLDIEDARAGYIGTDEMNALLAAAVEDFDMSSCYPENAEVIDA